MKNIMQRLTDLECNTNEIPVEISKKIFEMEQRIEWLEDIMENKVGAYKPKPVVLKG